MAIHQWYQIGDISTTHPRAEWCFETSQQDYYGRCPMPYACQKYSAGVMGRSHRLCSLYTESCIYKNSSEHPLSKLVWFEAECLQPSHFRIHCAQSALHKRIHKKSSIMIKISKICNLRTVIFTNKRKKLIKRLLLHVNTILQKLI